ncbi:YopJ family acetyltransferase, partial [Yersinia pestis]
MIGPISQINISGGLSEKETSSLISNEELKNIITQLETDISDGSWFHKNYSRMDVE